MRRQATTADKFAHTAEHPQGGWAMKYLICGIPCIEVCMESDHKKSFFYAGRYFVKEADYYGNDCQMAAIPPQDHDLI